MYWAIPWELRAFIAFFIHQAIRVIKGEKISTTSVLCILIINMSCHKPIHLGHLNASESQQEWEQLWNHKCETQNINMIMSMAPAGMLKLQISLSTSKPFHKRANNTSLRYYKRPSLSMEDACNKSGFLSEQKGNHSCKYARYWHFVELLQDSRMMKAALSNMPCIKDSLTNRKGSIWAWAIKGVTVLVPGIVSRSLGPLEEAWGAARTVERPGKSMVMLTTGKGQMPLLHHPSPSIFERLHLWHLMAEKHAG